MKTWLDAILETKRFTVTWPTAGTMNIWATTKSGNKSRSACGWDILNNIVKITEGDCPKFSVYKDHVEYSFFMFT